MLRASESVLISKNTTVSLRSLKDQGLLLILSPLRSIVTAFLNTLGLSEKMVVKHLFNALGSSVRIGTLVFPVGTRYCLRV